MTSYDYLAEVGAEELEYQNEEEACCLEVRALFAAQRGLRSNKKACSEANAAMNAAIGKTAEPRSIAATRAPTIALKNAAFAGGRSKLSIQVIDIAPAADRTSSPKNGCVVSAAMGT